MGVAEVVKQSGIASSGPACGLLPQNLYARVPLGILRLLLSPSNGVNNCFPFGLQRGRRGRQKGHG